MARISKESPRNLQGISKESPRNLQGISASLALLLAACCLLLAACGGGGGNLTTSSQPEPEPPVIGPLVPSSEGDGEQQKKKIIVIQQEEPEEEEQNEESEEIIDIIIEQPEEEEEEENQETQIQQITIIEEDIPYVPPEEKEPETSPQTDGTNGLNLEGLNIGEAFTIDRVTTTLEGSFPAGPTGGGAFPYGLWASEKAIHNNTNFIDNRIAFLELSSFLNPTTRPGVYTNVGGEDVKIRYKREDGFKGVYIYEGETGELTGDVDLSMNFIASGASVDGNISTDLEIEGNDLLGITLLGGQVDTTGVGGLTSELAVLGISYIKFGKTDLATNAISNPTMNDEGQGKIRMVLSPDGRLARGSVGGAMAQPESYPSYVAGEVEINGFKINSGDGDHNTVVGVFIGDKQED